MSISTQGIIYIATGNRHRQEALLNMRASLPYLDGRTSVLITDDPASVPEDIFSTVIHHPSPCFSYRDKIVPLIDLPFEINLFLDSDALDP